MNPKHLKEFAGYLRNLADKVESNEFSKAELQDAIDVHGYAEYDSIYMKHAPGGQTIAIFLRKERTPEFPRTIVEEFPVRHAEITLPDWVHLKS